MKLAAWAVCLGLGVVALPAQAFERQWHLGIGVGVGVLPDVSGAGAPFGESFGPPVLGAHTAYGLSDLFDWRLELTHGLHALSPGVSERSHLVSAATGLSYKLDVIEWIPYLGVLVGYHGRLGGPDLPGADEGRHDLGASLLLGLDHAISRDLVIGVQLRYSRTLDELDTVTGFLRVEHTWGF